MDGLVSGGKETLRLAGSTCSSTLRWGDIVVDAGANWGQYTWRLSSLVGPTGCVHAFEPDPIAVTSVQMPKLSLTLASVLTMGLCFAQSGAYAQTAEDAPPLAAERPEAAEEPEAPVEDIDDPGAGGLMENDPGAGGLIENDLGAGGLIENDLRVWRAY